MQIQEWPAPIYLYLAAAVALGVVAVQNFNHPVTILLYIACFVCGYLMGWCMRRYVS